MAATVSPISMEPVFDAGRFQFFACGDPKRLQVRCQIGQNAEAFWFDVTDCPVSVTARVFDASTGGRGSLVEFTHPITKRNESDIVWDSELSAATTSAVLERLASKGLTVFKETLAKNISTRSLFLKYLLNARPEMNVMIHAEAGWSKDKKQYVLGDEVFPPTDQISVRTKENSMLTEGAPDEDAWTALRPYIGKSTMWQFAAQIAFAGPLIKILGLPQSSLGGFLFHGGSGMGKSYATQIGRAVFGNKPLQFNGTRSGLEDIATSHNDRTLYLDELHQAGSQGKSESSGSAQIGQVIYDLANGTGRIRRKDTKTLAKLRHWQLVWFGTGEISAAEWIAPALGESKEGQRIRAADIPVDNPLIGTDLGVNEGRRICNEIDKLAPACNGFAGRAFLTALLQLTKAQKAHCKEQFEYLYTKHFAPLAKTGTQTRLAERCALVAFAGKLAQEWNLIDVGEGEETYLHAPQTVFKVWQQTVGTEALDDIQRCAQHVLGWIDTNRSERLLELHKVTCADKKQPRWGVERRNGYRGLAGFIEELEYSDEEIAAARDAQEELPAKEVVHLTSAVFRSLCKSFGSTPSVCRKFSEQHILHNVQGSTSYQHQLAEVREISLVRNDDVKLGKVLWRRNARTYSINILELERYAQGKSE